MNPQQNNTNRTTPKDFFLHLGAIVTLYASAIALINLLFSIINYYFPDQLAGYFYGNAVAWPISMLVVLIPLLYVFEWMIKKDIKLMPEKADILVRRWRIYITLFLAGAVIAGDLIALINTYLSGEISSRFVYKFITLIVILGIIFAYYLLDRVVDRSVGTKRILAYVGLVIVLGAVVAGFITVGSPSKQRSLRFDAQRVSDLQNIQYQVLNYWQQKAELPATLEDLNDPLYGSRIPTDPETEEAYEYNVEGQYTFELCANFDLTYEDTKGRGEYGYGGVYYARDMAMSYYPGLPGGDNWEYEAGRSCFERTIDPEKYPPFEKPQPLI